MNNYQTIDKLSALIESCVENIQFTVMCEADGNDKFAKVKALGSKAVKAIKYVFRLIADTIKSIFTKVKAIGRNDSLLSKDVCISKYVYIGVPTSITGIVKKLISIVSGGVKDASTAKKIDKLVADTNNIIDSATVDGKAIILKKGTKVRIDSLVKTAASVQSLITIMDEFVSKTAKTNMAISNVINIFNKIAVFLKEIIEDSTKVITASDVIVKNKDTSDAPMKESVDLLKVKLLTEAIRCLSESDEVTTTSVADDDEKVEVDQDDISEILGEEETVDTPYDPTASGGVEVGEKEDPVLDDEAIEDLLEDHKEALEILKMDDEGSELVEAKPEVAKDTEDTPASDDVDNANELLESIYRLNW